MAESPAFPVPGGGWFAFVEGQAIRAEAAPRAAVPAAAWQSGAPEPKATRRTAGMGALHLSLGGVALAVPVALAERILPMPETRPLPGAAPGVAGLAEAEGAPVLVLETGFIAGMEQAAPQPAAALLVLGEGRRRSGPPAEAGAGAHATAAVQP